MDIALRDTVVAHLPDDGLILAPGSAALDLPVEAARLRRDDLAGPAAGRYAAAVLTDDELSRAGDHAEELVDTVGTALEPGGVLVATVRNRVFAHAAGVALDGLRGYSAAEATALVSHRGFRVEVLAAPGAAARLRGSERLDLAADRQPGLLDAAPSLLLIARAPRTADERGRVFHDSRPRKIAAAATICRAADGRILVVYDRFKRHWTIPGGVVDADEDPAVAAHREAWEEAGTKIEVGTLLGVFASSWPDRLVFVFASTPVEVVEHPQPLHPHEIGGVAWWSLDDALERLGAEVAFKVRACLERPGHSWVQ